MLQQRTKRRAGFTFLEIMLVVVIIGILVALVGPRLVGRTQEARIKATQAQLSGIESALKTFEMDMGSFPKSLDELVEEPSDNDSWNGPYLATEYVPQDAWNQDFNYKFPGDNNKRGFDLWSKGPDKESGTDDDIGNWRKRN